MCFSVGTTTAAMIKAFMAAHVPNDHYDDDNYVVDDADADALDTRAECSTLKRIASHHKSLARLSIIAGRLDCIVFCVCCGS